MRRPVRHGAARVLAACLAALGAGALCAGGAVAASGTGPYAPGYAASPPTKGALYRDGQDRRYLLGGGWLYQADRADAGLSAGWWRDVASTSGWSPVTVPNSYNAGDFSSASMAGYVGWYRRDFTLPRHAFNRYVPAGARRWIIRFESVNYGATVWLNGRELGTHAATYLPFEFDLTRLRPGVNRLIVRVDDRLKGSDIPPGPGGGWWNFGGIQREVYLRAVQRSDIAHVQVRPVLRCAHCSAQIQEQAVIRNPTRSPQSVRLTGTFARGRLDFGRARIPPGGTWSPRATFVVGRPHLWAPGSPTLYRARLTLTDARHRYLAGYTDYAGIRKITVTPHGRLQLNGRLLDLRGVSIHEQDLAQGAALDSAHLASLMSWVRGTGSTIVRAHYPLNQQFEEMADRYGVLLWSEIPIWRVGSGYLAQPSWRSEAQADLTANIETNENHPSILLWSIANELPSPASAAEAGWISIGAGLAHRLDPTRPVAMAVGAWPGLACQSAYAPLDVIGVNEYFGWTSAGGGSTDDRDGLGPFLDALRACYPTQPLLVTEFGFEANRHGTTEERGTYEFQADTVAYHLGVFASRHWLSGAIYFALQDFAARPGWGGGDPWPDPPW
ncbi:MAG: glycoside hydrolase family 2 TIM barrel-domain containing protein, partial [Catenulispora sp.]